MNTRDEVISFTGTTAGNHALLILPLTPSALSPAPVIDLLRKHFPDTRITIVTDEHDNAVSALLPGSKIVRMGTANTSRFFLPASDVTQEVKTRRYDVAIDLNLDFLLPSAYICRVSNARVRIGLARTGAEMFFNFLMRPDSTRGAAQLYERLAAVVHMFTGSVRT
jgi:ADP-heptose:LPS heptosyltransferase